MADDYPEDVPADFLSERIDPNLLTANVSYLEEHELITAAHHGAKWRGISVLSARLTHKGFDSIQDDGGLGAILGVVTVTLREDTLKAIIESKVVASGLPEPEKKRFLSQLRELPGEATKHLVLKLLDAGMDNWNHALPLLQGMLGP
ncbi:hypothetical protein ROV86_19340 [Stenotrophomonas pavanii]|uniref:hypothetical protein n=1 Tax=Stenotrophomonas pavanii TaxID=487698 RepID=UPI0028952B82|nr:hypothetical protein [Stenotrophomonas pavanii]MDT3530257.1 hypothetical protein [Stenotrophomonas pavanii]